MNSQIAPHHTPSDARNAKLETTSPYVKAGLVLLILSAIGLLFSNIALFRIAGFAVTIPILLFGGAAFVGLLVPRSQALPVSDLLAVVALIGLWGLDRVLSLNLWREVEWRKSASWYAYLVVAFLLASRLRVTRKYLSSLMGLLAVSSVIFGALGIIQFLMLNLWKIRLVVPPELAVSRWIPDIDIHRTDGLQRAAGISLEPSTYSIGLAVLLMLIFYVYSLLPADRRRFPVLPVIILLAGSIVSFSYAGWAVALAVSLAAVLLGRLSSGLKLAMVAAFVTMIILYIVRWPLFVMSRLDDILSGTDHSMYVRIISAAELFFSPSAGFVDFMLGTGLGMEERYRTAVLASYVGFSNRPDIHNIFTAIRIMQGWAGVVLHLILLYSVVRPLQIRDWPLFAPVLAGLLLFHFASGYYLDPNYWALLALIRVMRGAEPDFAPQPYQNLSPPSQFNALPTS